MILDQVYESVVIDGHIAQARDDFAEFVATYTPPEGPASQIYLEPLLVAWLTYGNGIAATAGIYDHFLQTVMAITDAILTDTLSIPYTRPHAPQGALPLCPPPTVRANPARLNAS